MANSKVKVNPKYKDKLFCMLFGRSEYKENIISLYNALNLKEYTIDDLEAITTLDDVIYIKMKNDVSILIDSSLSLWEQQSSYNPNMPLRGLMYFASLYNNYISSKGLNIYGSMLIKIPMPKYIVFYNGQKELPPIQKLKLSDAFMNNDNSNDFEWTATMYNLNKGKNEGLLQKCKPLNDYMTLVNYIRENLSKGYCIEDAVDQAVQKCIEENVLTAFLKKHRSEVMNVCLTEYNEDVFINSIKDEGKTEGIAEGIAIGKTEGENKLGRLIEKLNAKKLYDDVSKAATDAEYRNKLYKEYNIED